MTEAKQRKKISPKTLGLVITLVVMLLCSLVNWGIITGWGNVDITNVEIVGDDGLKYTAIMYVPQSATNENPAPAALMIHGASGNARNHEGWAVEYARRGFVVLAIDHLGAGDGEYSSEFGDNATADLFCQYLLSCPIVDDSRLVIAAHSLGCGPAFSLGVKYNANSVILCGGVNAANPRTEMPVYEGNLLSIIGAAESNRPYETEVENTVLAFERNGVDLGDEEIQFGHVYGSFEEGNAKLAVFNEGQVHESAFVDRGNLEYQLDFLQSAMDVPNEIEPSDQVWMYKEYVGLAGIFSFAAFLIALFLFLAEKVPAFHSILQPMPRNIGLRGKGLAISIAAAILFPVLVLYTGSFGLWTLLSENEAVMKVFPLRQTGFAFSIVIGMAIMGFVMLLVFWFTEGRKHHATLRELGMTSEGKTGVDWKLMGKSLALAVIVLAVGFTYAAVQRVMLGTDFYAWFFGIRPLVAVRVQYYLPYIIVWMICFTVASIGFNVERRLPSTGSETKDTVIAVVFNVLCSAFTITFFVALQNAMQIQLGVGVPALANFTANMTRLWGLPAGLALSGVGNTVLYRKTGSVWPGVFLMGAVCALMACMYGQTRF